MAIDWKNLGTVCLEGEIPKTPKPKRQPRKIGGLFIPSMPLGWFIAATAALKTSAQVRFACLLYRRWVITGRKVAVVSSALGGGNTGGSRRLRRTALASLATAGLVAIERPAAGNRSARVRLIVTQAEPEDWEDCD